MKGALLSLLAACALAAPYARLDDNALAKRDLEIITITVYVTAGEPNGGSYTKAPAASSVAATAPVSSPTGSSGSSGSSGSISSLGYGLAYSPYLNAGGCKSQSEVDTDFEKFSGYGYIRSYGTDCNQTATILSAAKPKNMKLMAGIYDITDVSSEVDLIIQAAKSDWSRLAAVSVGNEGVNDGTYTVSAVVSAIGAVRKSLRAAGYNGPVVTVDTFDAMIANPELCKASDFAAANCHAFFDADMTAGQAGTYVKQQWQNVKNACGGKETILTESGWPSKGLANGLAVPSQANQDSAIASLKKSFSNSLILFSAYNNFWQSNTPATFETEWWWGLYGDSSSAGPTP